MKNKLVFLLGLALNIAVFTIPTKAQITEPYQWNSVAIGGGGFVSAIITSKEEPNLMYARTDVGGAYRWNAAKSEWIPLMDWASDQQQGVFGVESVAIDPQNTNIVYMSTGIAYFNNGRSYILKSTDYGENFSVLDVTSQFKAHGNGMGRQNGEKMQVDPNNSSIIYCGTRSNGLFKSTNAAASWSRVSGLDVTTTPNENGVSFIVLDKTRNTGGVTQRIFAGISRAGNNQNLYISEDAGTTFTPLINTNLPANLMPQRAVLVSGNLYITYGNGAGPHGTTAEPYDQGQLWKFNTTNSTWTNITPTGITRPLGGISVDPGNPNRLVASTTNTYSLQKGNAFGDKFFITTNGGTSWIDVVSRGFDQDANGVTWVNSSSIHWAGCIEFDPANTKRVLVTSGNGIFVNEDIDATAGVWKFMVKGLEETVPSNLVSIIGGPLVSVIRDYDGFRHTDIKQYAPIHNPRIGSTTGLDYAVTNKNKVVRVGGKNMFYSTDKGLTWTKTSALPGDGGQVAVSADGNIILHSSENNSSTTYRSVNNGTDWTTVTGLGIIEARPVADGVNSNKFYVYDPSSGNVRVSTDGGITFTSGGTTSTFGSKIMRTVPGREGHLWVALYGNGLTRSTNSGTSFQKLNNVTYCGAVGLGKSAPEANYETLFIWGRVNNSVLGIYRSTDEGANWVRVNDDKHEYGGPGNGQFIVGDMNTYGTVYMSTAGRGIISGEAFPKRFIALKNQNFTINENSVGGTVAVNPEVLDVNETNLRSWTILDGNTKNVFSINGTTGQITVATTAILDFETQPSYTLSVGMLDKNNAEVNTQVTINLIDLNEAPTDIQISKLAISQANVIGALVGTLSTTDVDANSSFTYSLVSGTGSADNAAFTINSNELKAAIVFNYNNKNTYNIRVKSTDNAGLTYEKAFVINIIRITTLPVTNFKVRSFNEVCAANNDGKISIEAIENLNYKATLTGTNFSKELTFNQTIEFSALQAGVYSLCITTVDIPDYQQCYNLTIIEPKPLAVYSSINPTDNVLTLSLSGSTSYNIELNNNSFTVDSGFVSLKLQNGVNNLKITTGKDCQGVFEKRFFIEDGHRVYPNPFGETLYVNLGNDSSEKVQVNIYSLAGNLVYSKDLIVSNREMELALSDLNSGTFILKTTTILNQHSFKIIKK